MSRIYTAMKLRIVATSLALITISASSAQKKPNIILILADDLGYADIGCYGQQKIATPNIDRLAQKGLRFTQFYSGSTVCAPARASLLTGLHTGHSPVRGNKGMKPEGQYPLPASSITFVSRLQKAGYKTAAFGKWGLGFITTTGDPQKKGFNEFYGYNCQTLAHNYFPDHLWQNHTRVELAGNLKSDSVYSADLIQSKAVDFIRKQGKDPFFLYLPYTLPHADVVVPHDSVYQYYVRKFAEPRQSQGKTTNDGEKHHFDDYPHAAFAAMVARLDSFVGQVVREVERKGLAENTLILFTSDNGPHKEHGGDPAFFQGSGLLRGIKRDLYEGGIRAPFIASWKGKINTGVSDVPAALWDLFPTFEELAGLPASRNIDGLSILPLLKTGKPSTVHPYFYWEFHEGTGSQAVRWGDWKAVRLNATKSENSPLELYNLKSDPSEKINVAMQNQDVVKKMATMMKEAHIPDKEWPFLPSERKQQQ